MLDYSSNTFPNRFRLFVFAVPEIGAGMITTGWTKLFTNSDLKDYYTVAYVAFFPLGFALLNSQESTVTPENLGCEITPMAARKWGEKPHIVLELPYMQLKDAFPAPHTEAK